MGGSDLLSIPKDQNPESWPLRVALISERGKFCTLWLPQTPEGRIQFDREAIGARLPLYFEAVDSFWYAFPGREGSFTSRNAPVPLNNRTILYYHYQQTKYALYIEEERLGDYEFISYYLEDGENYTIGRQEDSNICYPISGVSREHAVLRRNGGKWFLIDQVVLMGRMSTDDG